MHPAIQINMRAVLTFIKQRYIVLGALVILLVAGGFYLYYSSEEKTLERLAAGNPQKEQLAQTVQNARDRFANSSDTKTRVEALLDIGVAKAALGDLKGAAAAYDEILKLNPTHNIALGNLAAVYVQQEKYEQAERAYLTIIAAQSHLIEPYRELADLYDGYLKEKEAMVPAVLTLGMNQNGKQPALLERLIQYYFDKELYLLAGEQVDELLKIDPGNAFAKDVLRQIEEKS